MDKIKNSNDFITLGFWGYVRRSAILSFSERWPSNTKGVEYCSLVITLSNGLILEGCGPIERDKNGCATCVLQPGTEIDNLSDVSESFAWTVISPSTFPN